MARQLVCDNCYQPMESPITPIKLVKNQLPEVYKEWTHEQITAMQEIAKLTGGGSVVEQEFLDFCSTICV